jgi:uncharacterized protein (DUF697 family)
MPFTRMILIIACVSTVAYQAGIRFGASVSDDNAMGLVIIGLAIAILGMR